MKQNQNTIRILRMSDIAEGSDSATTAQEVDPLSEAAGGVDTSFPILAGDRIVRFEVVKTTVQKKEETGNEFMVLKMKTQKEVALDDGKTAKPGFTCYKRIMITVTPPTEQSEGRTIDAIKKDLSLALKCIGKPEVSAREFINNPSLFDGQVIDMKVGIQPAKGSYAASNTFAFVLPA